MAEKVPLVQTWQETISLNQALNLAGLSKTTWYYHHQKRPDKNAQLKRDLLQVVKDNPPYGYRRTHAELTDPEDGYGYRVGQEKVRHLMQDLAIQVARRPPHPKPGPVRKVILAAGSRANLMAQVEAQREVKPGEAGITDFTEIVYGHGTRKAHLMTILEYTSRPVFGWNVGDHKNIQLALPVWEKTKRSLRRRKFPVTNFIIHSDQDPVLTSNEWAHRVRITDQALLSYSLNGCHGNTRMEAWHSRFKGENASLFADCETLSEVKKLVAKQVRYYNTRRRHSALANKAPLVYLRKQVNARRKTKNKKG